MINLEGSTKLSTDEVMTRLRKYFGPGGQGLKVTEDNPFCIHFEGGGGSVNATVCTEGGKTKVNLVAQEWEYQAKEFLSRLP